MKAYWGAELQLHSFLNSTLNGGEWSTSLPDRFTLKERDPLDRRLDGPQSRCGRSDEKNSQHLLRHEPPIFQLVAQRYTTELYLFLLYRIHQDYRNLGTWNY
jgi:hypothetical protein